MSILNELLTKALELDRGDREVLVHELLYSLDGDAPMTREEWENSWGAEIEERLRRFEAGETEAIPFEKAMEQLRQSLRQTS